MIRVGDVVEVMSWEWDRINDCYDGGTGVVLEVDLDSDYPYKVKFDNAYNPKNQQEYGTWIWKELPIRRKLNE